MYQRLGPDPGDPKTSKSDIMYVRRITHLFQRDELSNIVYTTSKCVDGSEFAEPTPYRVVDRCVFGPQIGPQ